MNPRKQEISAGPIVLGVAVGVVIGFVFHFPAAKAALQHGQHVRLEPVYLILGAIGGAVWGLSKSFSTRRWRS